MIAFDVLLSVHFTLLGYYSVALHCTRVGFLRVVDDEPHGFVCRPQVPRIRPISIPTSPRLQRRVESCSYFYKFIFAGAFTVKRTSLFSNGGPL